MVAADKTRPALNDEEIGKLLTLVKGVDSVELKVTVPESDLLSAVSALEMDPLNAQIRQVFFFDTPDLTLNQHGIVARARRVQQKVSDSVVKLRPVVPNELPKELRKSPTFKVEVDAMPGGYVCSGSFKGTLGMTEVREAAIGKRRLRTLFSKEQRAFFAQHAPAGLELDDLSILGPIFVLKLKFSPEGFERRLVAELWLFPDNSRVLELSTTCAPSEMMLAAAETRAFLTERGVDLSGEQQAKTRKALEFYSARLQAADGKGGHPGPSTDGQRPG